MRAHYFVVRLHNDAGGKRYLGGPTCTGWATGVPLRDAFRWATRPYAKEAALQTQGRVVRVRRRPVPANADHCPHGAAPTKCPVLGCANQ
jgi:hypothetical protein